MVYCDSACWPSLLDRPNHRLNEVSTLHALYIKHYMYYRRGCEVIEQSVTYLHMCVLCCAHCRVHHFVCTLRARGCEVIEQSVTYTCVLCCAHLAGCTALHVRCVPGAVRSSSKPSQSHSTVGTCGATPVNTEARCSCCWHEHW